MHTEHGLRPRSSGASPVAMTIGNFDGVHIGHRALLDRTVAAARDLGGESVAVIFDPHPRCVLDPERCPQALTTLDEKRDLIASQGIDRLVVLRFTRELSRWSADEFCDQLTSAFTLRRLVVGPDFAFGHDRQGNVAYLSRSGSDRGFDVDIVEPVRLDGEVASSSLVRGALAAGDLERANSMLGYGYVVDALVVHGDKIGATLGYPTANLAAGLGKCLPAPGVYTMWLRAEGTWHMAAASLGFRPTFGGDRLRLEAFLLDFTGDLYHQRVRAVFVGRLREERMYPDTASLIAQIAVDVEDTRRALTAAGPPDSPS